MKNVCKNFEFCFFFGFKTFLCQRIGEDKGSTDKHKVSTCNKKNINKLISYPQYKNWLILFENKCD